MTCGRRCRPQPDGGILAKKIEGKKDEEALPRRQAQRDSGRSVGHFENAPRYQPARGRAWVRAQIVDFPINDLLEPLRTEFAYHTRAEGLELARPPLRLGRPKRSAPARSADPQPAVQRGQIYRARRKACSAAAARRHAADRSLGHRPGHPQRTASSDFRMNSVRSTIRPGN